MQQEQARTNIVQDSTTAEPTGSRKTNPLIEHFLANTELARAHLNRMKRAAKARDMDCLRSLAKSLNEACGRCGAFRMVSLCVSLQMLGQHSFVERAQDLVVELEAEYLIFTKSLHVSGCV